MLGNAWEWTCSLYKEKYDGSEQRCLSPKDDGLLVEAAYARDKQAALADADRRLNGVRHLWRLAYELETIPLKRYEHGAGLLVALGK